MKHKKASEIEANYSLSRQASSLDWEVSIFWQREPGRSGSPFRGLNRVTKPGGKYARIRLLEGTIEYFIVDGAFRCNGVEYAKGDYVRFEVGETMDWTSDAGVMMIVLDGQLAKGDAA